MRTLAAVVLSGWLILLVGCGSTSLTQTSPAATLTGAQTLPALEASPVSSPTQTVPPRATGTSTAAPTGTSTPTETPAPPATQTPEPLVRFAVIGDYGLEGQALADVAGLIESWQVDLVITTGDNNYPDGARETIDANIGRYFHAYIDPYLGSYGSGASRNRFFPTLGNHDWTTEQATPYLEYFSLPGNERYYDFTWEFVHFFALDSNSREPDGVGSSSIQADWLKERLSSSTALWKIVYMHQPPYSSGYEGSIDWARWPYREWGATAVLGGHDHDYERLLLDGLTYFVNGLGGGPVYPVNAPVPGSQVLFNQDNGAMLVEATRQQINFQFITRSGLLVDTYSIDAPTNTGSQ